MKRMAIGRRQFGQGAAAWAALPALARAARPATRIVLPERATGRVISDTLVSLSYETELLADSDFFSPSNHELVAAFRRLNPRGVLRIGGNTADRAIVEGFDGTLPALHPLHFGRDRVQPYFSVSERALEQLAAFLDVTGWRLIFGINLRADSAALCTAFRRIVEAKIGHRLLAFQIGNEANNYFDHYEDYFAHWKAAQGLVPWDDLAGPDTGANTDWVMRFSRDAPKAPLLSRHYYRGPAPQGSLTDILRHDSAFDAELALMAQVAAGHPYGLWLTEANSYYYGGLAGVSDSFASMLWGLDFLLSAASNGVEGICFHGGPRSIIDNSLEGYRTTPSAASDADVGAARRMAASNYSPISGDLKTGFGPTPLYHAMYCAAQLAGARLYRLDPSLAADDLRCHAVSRGGEIWVILLNNNLSRPEKVSIENLPKGTSAEVLHLEAIRPTVYDLIGFPSSGARPWRDDAWALPFKQLGRTRDHGDISISLAPASAVLLRVRK